MNLEYMQQQRQQGNEDRNKFPKSDIMMIQKSQNIDNQIRMNMQTNKASELDFDDLCKIDDNPEEVYQKYFQSQQKGLQNQNKYQQTCSFYFQMLRKLQLCVHKAKIGMEQEKELIKDPRSLIEFDFEQEKNLKGSSSKEQQIQANYQTKHKKQISRIQPQKNEHPQITTYQCKTRACNKTFDKKQTLLLHQRLKHNSPPHQLHQNKIFHIQIKDWSQLSSAKRFK